MVRLDICASPEVNAHRAHSASRGQYVVHRAVALNTWMATQKSMGCLGLHLVEITARRWVIWICLHCPFEPLEAQVETIPVCLDQAESNHRMRRISIELQLAGES